MPLTGESPSTEHTDCGEICLRRVPAYSQNETNCDGIVAGKIGGKQLIPARQKSCRIAENPTNLILLRGGARIDLQIVK